MSSPTPENAPAQPAPKKRRSCLRWVGYGIVVLVLLVLGLALGVRYLLPADWLRQAVVQVLQDRTGREVEIADVQIGLSGATLEDLVIAGAQPSDPPLLEVEYLQLDLSLTEMLQDSLQGLRGLRAEGILLRLRRSASGAWNIDDILRRSPSEGGDAADTGLLVAALLSEAVQVQDATVLVEDAISGANAELVAQELTLTSDDINRGIEIRGTFSPGAADERGSVVVSGVLDLFEKYEVVDDYSGTLHLVLDNLRLPPLLQDAGVSQAQHGLASGGLSGKVDLALAPATLTLVPQAPGLLVQNLALQREAEPLPVPETRIAGSLALNWETLVLALQKARVENVLIAATFDGTVDAGREPMAGEVRHATTLHSSELVAYAQRNNLVELPLRAEGDIAMTGLLTLQGQVLSITVEAKDQSLKLLLEGLQEPAALRLNGSASAEYGGAAPALRAALQQTELTIPGQEGRAPLRLTLQGALAASENRLQVQSVQTKAFTQGEEAFADLRLDGSLNADATGAVTAQGMVQLAGLSQALGMQPKEAASLAGAVDLAAQVQRSGDKLVLTPLAPGGALLSGDSVTVLGLSPAIPRLPVEDVALTAESVTLTDGQRVSARSLVLRAGPLTAALSVEGEPGRQAYGIGYRLQVDATRGRSTWEALGLLDTPLESATATGTLQTTPRRMVFSGTSVVAQLLMDRTPYRLTGSHDLTLLQSETGELTAIEVGQILASLNNRQASVASLNVRKGARANLPLTPVSWSGTVTAEAALEPLLALARRLGPPEAVRDLQSYDARGQVRAELVRDQAQGPGRLQASWSEARLASGQDLWLQAERVGLAGSVMPLENGGFAFRDSTLTTAGDWLTMRGALIVDRLPVAGAAGDARAVRWAIGQGSRLEIDADVAGTAQHLPPLARQGSGTVRKTVTLLGPLDALQVQADARMQNVRLEQEGTTILMPATTGTFAALFDIDRLVTQGAPADENPYAYMTVLGVRDGTLALDRLQINDTPVANVRGQFALQNGVLSVSPVSATLTGPVDGAATVDFKQVPPACSGQVNVDQFDLAAMFPQEIAGTGRIQKGMLWLPAPDAQPAFATASWRGFASDAIWQTLDVPPTPFRLDDVQILARVDRDWFGVLNLLPERTLDRLTGLQSTETGDVKPKQYTLQSVTGRFHVQNQRLVIPELTIIGKDTADFAAEVMVDASQNLAINLYPVGHLERFVDVGDLVDELTDRADLSPQERETMRARVMERLNAAAAKRELVIKIRGTLSRPEFPKSSRLMEDVLAITGAGVVEGARDIGLQKLLERVGKKAGIETKSTAPEPAPAPAPTEGATTPAPVPATEPQKKPDPRDALEDLGKELLRRFQEGKKD